MFEDNELTISQVSYDIRSLELILKKYCLNFTYTLLVCNEVNVIPKPDSEDANVAQFVHEYLSWELNEKEKKSSLRIFYKKYGRLIVPNPDEPLSNIVSDVHTIPASFVLLERRPLVETPISVRLKMYPYLPIFLKKLAYALFKAQPSLDFARFQHTLNEFEKAFK